MVYSGEKDCIILLLFLGPEHQLAQGPIVTIFSVIFLLFFPHINAPGPMGNYISYGLQSWPWKKIILNHSLLEPCSKSNSEVAILN